VEPEASVLPRIFNSPHSGEPREKEAVEWSIFPFRLPALRFEQMLGLKALPRSSRPASALAVVLTHALTVRLCPADNYLIYWP
jgi:hypothetical protein